jgi:hypothetical protein
VRRRARLTTLLLGAFSASALLTVLAQAAASQRNDPQAQTEQQSNANDHRGTEAMPLVVKTVQEPKSRAEIAREDAREKAKSQVDGKIVHLTGSLALWTGLLFLATAILAIATGGLVWVGFRQIEDAKASIAAAVKAAEAADRGRVSSEHDLRAWLKIDADLTNCYRKPDCAFLSVRVRIKNIGKTPAFRVGYSVACRVVSGVVINHGPMPTPVKWPSQMSPLLPGDKRDELIGLRIEKADIDKGITDARGSSGPMIVIDALVYYHTIFDAEGDEKRMTSIRYTVHPNMTEPAAHAARKAWLDTDGPASLDQVRVRRDMSAPAYLT